MLYAVIVDSHILTPTDNRKDPPETFKFKEFIEFKDEDELKTWIIRNELAESNKKTYKVLAYNQVQINISISTSMQATII